MLVAQLSEANENSSLMEQAGLGRHSEVVLSGDMDSNVHLYRPNRRLLPPSACVGWTPPPRAVPSFWRVICGFEHFRAPRTRFLALREVFHCKPDDATASLYVICKQRAHMPLQDGQCE